MVAQFAALKFIAPEHIGAWQAVLVIQIYLMAAQMGIISALNREYPYASANGEDERAKRVMQTAQAYNIANAVLVAGVLSVLLAWQWDRGWVWQWAYGIMAGVAALNLIQGYLSSVCRCTGHFNRVAAVNLVRIPFLSLVPLGAWYFGFKGYCVAQLLVAFIQAFGLFLVRPLKLIPKFEMTSFKLLFNTGWRLYLRHYLMRIGKEMPRTALATIEGAMMLGLYAPVNAINAMLTNITASLQAYLVPNLTAKIAEGHPHVGKLAIKAWLMILLVMFPLLLLAELLVPPLVAWFLPAYADAIPAMRVAMIGGYLQSSDAAATVFTAAKAWRSLYLHVLLRIVTVATGVFAGLLLMEDPLLGVATGMTIASAALVVPTWYLASRIKTAVNE